MSIEMTTSTTEEPTTVPEDDQLLWDAAVSGDADAFGTIFDRYQGAIYTYCFRRVSSWPHAEELTSVVFFEAWRTRRPLDLGSNGALPWLVGIATRVTHRHHRSIARHSAMLARISAQQPRPSPDLAEDVAARVDDERRMTEIRAHLVRLPQRDQDVIEVCLFLGRNYEQAAEALNIPVGTVRSRLSRARRRLAAGLHVVTTPPPDAVERRPDA